MQILQNTFLKKARDASIEESRIVLVNFYSGIGLDKVFGDAFLVATNEAGVSTLRYRGAYRSYTAAGKLCYRLRQRVSVPRCTLRRHYICPIHMPRHVSPFLCVLGLQEQPLIPSGSPSAFCPSLSPSVSLRFLAWIRAGDRNSNASRIMGRFRLETSTGNSPSAGYCSAAD